MISTPWAKKGTSALAFAIMANAAWGQFAEAPPPVRLLLYQQPSNWQMKPGPLTPSFQYYATVMSGPTTSVQPVYGTYASPTLEFWKGQQVTVDLYNNMGESTITHWHGLDVPSYSDGGPFEAFDDGDRFRYKFTVQNRAGTYWYHPHPHMRTGFQAYAGLAGFLFVRDKEEQLLNLPSGEYEVPLCIQDVTLDSSNQRQFSITNTSGFFGNEILVNQKLNYVHNVATKVYRLRILNGSSSRILKLQFSDSTPLVVIGNDGGLLRTPVTKPYVMLAPGERVELWADFRNKAVGSNFKLRTISFNSGGGQGGTADLMTFNVNRFEPEARTLSPVLSEIEDLSAQLESPKVNRTFAINTTTINSQTVFSLNGGTFQTNGSVATNEVVRKGALEVVRITNTGGSPLIPHPIHFHGRPFQILSRSVTASQLSRWNTVKDGLVDEGWKDTFLIMPGETVRIAMRWPEFTGKYMYHCHNLPHEDMGMMRTFEVVP